MFVHCNLDLDLVMCTVTIWYKNVTAFAKSGKEMLSYKGIKL